MCEVTRLLVHLPYIFLIHRMVVNLSQVSIAIWEKYFFELTGCLKIYHKSSSITTTKYRHSNLCKQGNFSGFVVVYCVFSSLFRKILSGIYHLSVEKLLLESRSQGGWSCGFCLVTLHRCSITLYRYSD